VFTEQSKSACSGDLVVLSCLQNFNDVRESVENIITSIKQVLVPFVRTVTLIIMAIHSWVGFRREIGRMATQIESTTQRLNLKQFPSIRYQENLTTIPSPPQSAPTSNSKKLL
jgi:hypothetical protein